jgi:hypothetical protein
MFGGLFFLTLDTRLVTHGSFVNPGAFVAINKFPENYNNYRFSRLLFF